MLKRLSVVVVGLITAVASGSAWSVMTDHKSLPPTQYVDVDPNVMINLSVETPMGGAAYNDQPDGGSCGGRVSRGGGSVGICYFPANEYLGYFDSEKCYTYNAAGGYFQPAGAVLNASHQCSGQYSGNFMNWASMTAIDMFVWTMTGGNRVVDTTTETIVERKRKQNNDSWFPHKYLNSGDNVAPSTVTPWSDSSIYIYNTSFGIQFGTSRGGNERGAYNLRLKVCDSSVSLEDNCKQYGSNYKPEGLVQNNALRMRYALMSYLSDGSQSRDGGVLRANMKYVGPLRPAVAGGFEVNPGTEWDATTGVYVTNPNPTDASASSVSNSGVINYLNKFASTQNYKSYDPIGELFYEVINYYKHRGPTPEYSSVNQDGTGGSLNSVSSGAAHNYKDGFPVVTVWDDPIVNSCQQNYIIGINDANPWMDKSLPGTAVTSSTTYSPYGSGSWGGSDWGAPGNADASINVTSLTNTVGDLQGISGTSRDVGCVPTSCDLNSNSKTINQLGRAFGTAPYSPKENSYYIAGLAYYARSTDIRSGAGDFDGMQTITTFMIDTQEYSANPLVGEMNMLWLAGKYGGFKETNFNDSNSDGNAYEPDLASEWDEDGDGQPDNYVLATKPDQLVTGLARAFRSISDRLSAGSSAAVITNSAAGAGAVVQALYQPQVDDTVNGRQIEWAGIVHSIFIDSLGNLREDTDGDAVLDDYATDYVVQFYYDTSVTPNRTRIRRYDTTDGITLTYRDTIELTQLGVVWNARDRLSELPDAAMVTNRTYGVAVPTSGTNAARYIFTWIDDNKNGVVDSGEVKDFTTTALTATDLNHFDETTAADAQTTVNYVRGVESAGLRTRTIDYDNDGTNEVWRLGDVIHSSPVVIGAPSGYYDVLYGDTTYTAYREAYENRRQVTIFGANDGLLHAVNSGFYDSANERFLLSPAGETAHPLGAEIWAYAPYNLLPHLQWLKNIGYPHVFYVDGPVRAFDVKIFTPDSVHTNGWGTIVVATMRLGGNPIDVDTDGDATDDWTSHSAVIVMDVTDPENPPTLLAEITHPSLGFTTSVPELMVRRSPGAGVDWGNPSENGWYLVFGSGPTDLQTAESTQNARLFIYDLATKDFVTNYNGKDLGVANSFVGNPRSASMDNDFVADVVYYGIAGGSVSAPDGRLMRYVPGLTVSAGGESTLLNPGKPFLGRPVVSTDEVGNWWVMTGTGRFFVRDDNRSTARQAYYGVKDPLSGGSISSVSTGNLVETTGVQVFADRSLQDPLGVISPALGTNTFDALMQRIAGESGWFYQLDNVGSAERNFTNSAFFRGLTLFTTYDPPSDVCEAEGEGRLFALYYKTGTAYPDAGLGNSSTTTNGSGSPLTQSATVPQPGAGGDPVVIEGNSGGGSGGGGGPGGGGATVLTNQSTGTLTTTGVTAPPVTGGRQSWREVEL